MNSRNSLRLCLITFVFGALGSAHLALAAPSPAPKVAIANTSPNEITVSLFGQPCLLSGPIEKNILRTIHSISPAQVYPEPGTAVSSDFLRKAIDKVKTANNVPPQLDGYRERLTKRLESQLVLANGLSAAKKAGKSEPLVAATKTYIPSRRLKEFETLARKLDGKKGDAELEGQIFLLFSEMVEADPEEDFHKAIQRMSVRYTCDFADEGESEEE